MQPLRALRPLLALALVSLGPLAGRAAAQFDYSVAFDTGERRWSVEGSFANPSGDVVDFWIARWTPGAYHVADYGRYIDDFHATDGDRNTLDVTRVSDSHFRIAAADAKRVVVTYGARAISTGLATHEGMILDVESNRIAADYAYVTPVSLFGFVPDRMDEPFSLRVDAPKGWKTATVLRRDGAGTYHAESFQRFEDSPLFFSPALTTVEVTAAGKPLAITVYGKGEREVREIVDGCVGIVESACELMGGAPYDRYHFLIGFVPEAMGSGLEHSYSTLILINPHADIPHIWPLVAHEYFHLWCAERIHVQSIHRPDYTQPLETKTAWLNESMTEYMTQHVLFHAGMYDVDELFAAVAPREQVDRMAKQMPSQTETSLAASDWEDMNDLMTWSVKMYEQGSRIMFGLDLRMRAESHGERGVLDLLRYAMSEYAAHDRGFPEDGIPAMLDHVAGGSIDDFYARHIAGTEPVDIDADLGVIGCEMVDGKIRVVDDPTEAQSAALEDFLSIDG